MSAATIRTGRAQPGLRRLIGLCGCLALSGLVNAASSGASSSDLTPRASEKTHTSAYSSGQSRTRGAQKAMPKRPLTATFVNPGLRGERFWDMVTDTMQAAALDLNISLEVVYAERNPYLLKKLAIQVLERPAAPDYLLLVNEEQAASELLTIADSHDTHVLMLLNGLTREEALSKGDSGNTHSSWIGSIIPDNHTAGKRMATQLVKTAREKSPAGQLQGLALIGDTQTPASIARNAGMVAGFSKDKAISIDRILEARWNSQDAEHLTAQYLKWVDLSGGQSDLIWAANDAMAEGAILALESAGLTPGEDVLVAGLNWSPEGIRRVSERSMLLTDGGHFMAGAWSMVMVRDHAEFDNWTPRIVQFPMSQITHENVDLYAPILESPSWETADFKTFCLQDPLDTYEFDPMITLRQMIDIRNKKNEMNPHHTQSMKQSFRNTSPASLQEGSS